MSAAMDLVGYDVIDEGSQRLIGTVTDVLFDDDCRRVLALVALDHVRRGWSAIAFDDIQAFREGAIVARVALRGSAATTAAAQAATSGSLQGKPVVTVKRRYLGTLNDVYFDQRSGRVIAFEVRLWDPRRTSPALRLFGIESARLIAGVLVVSVGHRDKAAARRAH
jgi:uncharacterized protein YrrD